MMHRRMAATDQLSTVIDALQLGKKTGILTVERGDGKTYEEGTITLVHGQVVQAVIGSYQGRDAVTKLLSWQACRFSFASMLPEHISQQSFPTSHVAINKVSENRYQPFHGTQQPELNSQDAMSRQPSITIYYSSASMNGILHRLEEQGLSRTHRRLFLLIDGRRSIRELASLIRRTPDETAALLAEMEQAGLIQM